MEEIKSIDTSIEVSFIPPPGFFTTNEILNSWDFDIVKEMITDSISHFFDNSNVFSFEKYKPNLNNKDTSIFPLDHNNIQNINRTLHFILESSSLFLFHFLSFCLRYNLNISSFLKKESILSTKIIQYLSEIFQEKQKKQNNSFKTFHLSQFKSLSWKIGMGISSNNCRHLSAPFVILSINIIDSNGHESNHPFELSLKEFQGFRNNFQQMYSHFSSV